MFRRWIAIAALVAILATVYTYASVFGSVHGIVHDPQHRPISGVDVKIKSASSDWSQATTTNDDGEFTFTTVPIGDYRVTVRQRGFADAQQAVTVTSGTAPVLHFSLNVAATNEVVDVSAEPPVANVESSTPTTLVSRSDIART